MSSILPESDDGRRARTIERPGEPAFPIALYSPEAVKRFQPHPGGQIREAQERIQRVAGQLARTWGIRADEEAGA